MHVDAYITKDKIGGKGNESRKIYERNSWRNLDV